MYESFARVYDAFMDDTPYQQWCARIREILCRYRITDGLVLDLGCGTGAMTRLLRDAGYDMIGADNSPEMLEIAREKEAWDPDSRILYLLQDMRSFELYGTVRAVVSICDCMNYLESEDDLLQVFSLVNNYLDPGGIFLFDMNTAYKYETLLGDGTFAQSLDECSYIWENTWYPEEQINEYGLTLFVQRPDGLYERFEETHYQKAFSVERVSMLLEKAGLACLGVYDGYENMPAHARSERVLFAAGERTKANDICLQEEIQ